MEKYLYTIGEVAQMLGESTSLVRFWANEFPKYIKPQRNAKGNRLFTKEDLETFKHIHLLVKVEGLTLEGAAKRMKDNITGEDKRVEVISMLTSIKEKLMSVSAMLDNNGTEEDEGN